MPFLRKFQDDFNLMTQQDAPGAPGVRDPGADGQPPAGSPPPGTGPGAGPVRLGAGSGGPGGALAARIYRSAVARLGTDNGLYWRDKNLACASFVSTVLADVGLNKGPGDSRLFTRSAHLLTNVTEAMGATPVFGGHAAPFTAENLAQIQDGDIVQFQEPSDSNFSHSGIGERGAHLIYASSSGFQIRRATIRDRWSGFNQFQIHRFK